MPYKKFIPILVVILSLSFLGFGFTNCAPSFDTYGSGEVTHIKNEITGPELITDSRSPSSTTPDAGTDIDEAEESNQDQVITEEEIDDQLEAITSVIIPGKQFEIGLNIAWSKIEGGSSGFGKDFGGAGTYTGISGRKDSIEKMFKDLSENKVTFVRWWLWPKLIGRAVLIENDTVTGLGGSTFADIHVAIDMARKYGVQIMFCFYSFDTFNISAKDYPANPTISNMLRDPAKLTSLVDNSIGQFVEETYKYISDNNYSKDLIHSWDIVNEPEWAIHRTDFTTDKKQYPNIQNFGPCVDDPRYATEDGTRYHFCNDIAAGVTPSTTNTHHLVDAVTVAEMENFIIKAAQKIKSIEGTAKITVGFASEKWSKLWSQNLINHVDIIQNHFYQWVQDYRNKYNMPTSELYDMNRYGGKRIIMGEYPFAFLKSGNGPKAESNVVTHAMMLETWYQGGYSGVMGWHYYDPRDTITPLANMPDSYKQYTIERALGDLKIFSEAKGIQPPITPITFLAEEISTAAPAATTTTPTTQPVAEATTITTTSQETESTSNLPDLSGLARAQVICSSYKVNDKVQLDGQERTITKIKNDQYGWIDFNSGDYAKTGVSCTGQGVTASTNNLPDLSGLARAQVICSSYKVNDKVQLDGQERTITKVINDQHGWIDFNSGDYTKTGIACTIN